LIRSYLDVSFLRGNKSKITILIKNPEEIDKRTPCIFSVLAIKSEIKIPIKIVDDVAKLNRSAFFVEKPDSFSTKNSDNSCNISCAKIENAVVNPNQGEIKKAGTKTNPSTILCIESPIRTFFPDCECWWQELSW
jgi:hypothetical protein